MLADAETTAKEDKDSDNVLGVNGIHRKEEQSEDCMFLSKPFIQTHATTIRKWLAKILIAVWLLCCRLDCQRSIETFVEKKSFLLHFFIYNRALLLLLTFKALLFTSCVVEGRLSTNGGGSTLAHNIMWYRFLVLLYYYNSSSKKGGSGCVCTLARDHHFWLSVSNADDFACSKATINFSAAF